MPREAVARLVESKAFAWKLEEETLNKVHAALGQNPDGLKLSDLAVATGVGRGYLDQILKSSDCVLKLVPGTYRWIADWGDVPASYRPTAWASSAQA